MPCYKNKEYKKFIDSRSIEKPEVKIEDINVLFNTDDYWKICCRLSEFLDKFYEEVSYEDLPMLFKTIDSITEFVAEYNSSGLFGYLDHCSGANAEDFKEALRTIDADEFIRIMDSVSTYFPNSVIPIVDDIRFDIL